jgi:hypothetical protein
MNTASEAAQDATRETILSASASRAKLICMTSALKENKYRRHKW